MKIVAKSFLIVDDTLFMRRLLKEAINSSGYRVIAEASNGNEAIQQYKKTNPDWVTMDITMPNKDGLEALEEIMQFDPTAKIIVCSAIGQQHMITKALQLGAKDFLVKPIKLDKLNSILDNMV